MFGHLPELFIILVIALVVFGPEKLPEVAANAGKMVREVRQIVDDAMHPPEHEPEPEATDDFSAYYYESLARSGEEDPHEEEPDEVPEAEPVHYDWAPGTDAGESNLSTDVHVEPNGAVALAKDDRPPSREPTIEPPIDAEKNLPKQKSVDTPS